MRTGQTALSYVSLSLAIVVLFIGGTSSDILATSEPFHNKESAAPDAQTVEIEVHNYNLCGASCVGHDNYDPSRAVDLATWNFVGHDADFLSLQEVCLAQLEEIYQTVSGPVGFWFVESRQSVGDCDVAGMDGFSRSYGNAVLYRTQPDDAALHYLSNPGRDCSQSNVECRTMICISFQEYQSGGMCSSHLINQNAELAQMQANEYIFIATGFLGTNRLRLLGGDFNLHPPEMPNVYGSYTNDNLVWGDTIPAPNPDHQYDYIWAYGGNNYGRGVPCSDEVNFSDHCYTWGSVGWSPS